MAYDARAIANEVLERANHFALPITNMALNKIIYFSHGWYLATRDKPFINSEFEAWEHGPVLPNIYHQFKNHGQRPISTRALMIDVETGADILAVCDLCAPDAVFLDRMVNFYGIKSGTVLSMMSHEPDAPWAQTRYNNPRPGMVISDRAIRDYFLTKLIARTRRSDAH